MFAEWGVSQTDGRHAAAGAEDIAERHDLAADQKRATVKRWRDEAQYKEYPTRSRGCRIPWRSSTSTEKSCGLARSGMSDPDCVGDRKADAGEFTRGAPRRPRRRSSCLPGNVEQGERPQGGRRVADKATQLQGPEREVKRGDQVVISHGHALRTAMDGVREAGDFKADIIRSRRGPAGRAGRAERAGRGHSNRP